MKHNIIVNSKKFIMMTSIIFALLVYFFVLIPNNMTAMKLFRTELTGNNEEDDDDEPQRDNWEISAVFYDSTVDNGNTPLTEINWDATDGTLKDGEERTIIIQINYKNSNTSKTYNPGDLLITLPRIAKSYQSTSDYPFKASIIVGANDTNHTGYDWTFRGYRKKDNYSEDDPNYLNYDMMTFSNNKTIESKTNVEGSIQIMYTIKPAGRSVTRYEDSVLVEVIKDVNVSLLCIDHENPKLMTSLDNINYVYEKENATSMIFSFASGNYSYQGLEIYDRNDNKIYDFNDLYYFRNNPLIIDSDYARFKFEQSYSKTFYYIPSESYVSRLKFNYSRLYVHPWTKKSYELRNDISKITSIDNFPSNYNDYIWVGMRQNTNLDYKYNHINYPDIGVDYEHSYLLDVLPAGVRVYDKNMNLIEPNDNKYVIQSPDDYSYGHNNTTYGYGGKLLYLAFPKSIYNIENNNMNVSINSELWGIYANEDEYVKLDEEINEIDLNDYNLEMPEEIYKVSKSTSTIIRNLYVQDVKNGVDNIIQWNFGLSVNYTGTPYNIKIGDDMLFYVDSNGNVEKLNDNDYYFKNIQMNEFVKTSDTRINKSEKYDFELWVRFRNDSNYTLYYSSKYTGAKTFTFGTDEKVVGFYIVVKGLTESITSPTNIFTKTFIEQKDVDDNSVIYNFNYFDSYYEDEHGHLVKQNNVTSADYNILLEKGVRTDIITRLEPIINEIADYDMDLYGEYKMRNFSYMDIKKYVIPDFYTSMLTRKSLYNSYYQDAEKELFTGTFSLKTSLEEQKTDSDIIVNKYGEEIDEKYFFKGLSGYDLLPLGMKLTSTEQDILDSISVYWETYYTFVYGKKQKKNLSKEELLEIVKNNISLSIVNNYKGTNRTFISYSIDLTNNPILLSNDFNYTAKVDFTIKYNFEVSYDSILEYGNTYRNNFYASLPSTSNYLRIGGYNGVDYKSNSIKDNGYYDEYVSDINNNGDTEESISYTYYDLNLLSVVSTNQDVQTSVQTDKSNYDTGKVETSKNSEYSYKLRVRTGTNDVTNLVIYDSIEMYAKDPDMNFVKASGLRKNWNGEFLGIDTSYAEGKGYTVKTYYSENDQPGSLSEDTSWKEYTDSVDKTKVKSLAFKYLDSNNNPAVLPANSMTYVLIRMKSPNADLKTYTYNGAWTQWNAIDPLTSEPVDFITGINSNIVKVGFPTSVEPEDINITVEKTWDDRNNVLNVRPDSVTLKLIKNGDYSTSENVTVNASNNWRETVTVPKYDEDGELINYTIDEDSIPIENGLRYIPSVDDYTITNTINKDITLTKIWKDNTNAYTTRPNNVTFKLLQDGNLYKNVIVTGNYSTNTWSNTVSVPLYKNNGTEYTYTIEEVTVDGYSSSCQEFTCTNTLIDDENITITKEWVDGDNIYNTRPNSIEVTIKQNGNNYRSVILNGTNNIWTGTTIVAPKYDSDGVKYTYTLEENNLDEYGSVNYNLSNYKITNTLNKNINVNITKKWIDDNNSNNTRPSSLTIHLLRNNNNYKTVTLTGDTDTWTTSLEVPKYDENQLLYTYSIKEVNDDIVNEYQNVTYSLDELTVTNKLQKIENVRIRKVWQDSSNKYNTRPEEVDVKLYQNGTLFRSFKMNSNNEDQDTWYYDLEDVPKYDNDGKRYNYTLEEIAGTSISRYESISYDNPNFTITGELTQVPTVNLYFIVKSAYTEPGTNILKYDSYGLRRAFASRNIDPDSDYTFKFELKNLDDDKIYEGKLSTTGVLEFNNIPYGRYRAIETEDSNFSFVDMLSVTDIPGVTFKKDGNGGIITIEPIGENITYGATIVNKISMPIVNPSTNGMNIKLYLILLIISLIGGVISSITIVKEKVVYHY